MMKSIGRPRSTKLDGTPIRSASATGEPCFFIELQRAGVKDQDDINPLLIRLARELDLPLVCDNDVHFLNADDYDVHDTLCCISMQKNKDDDSRLHYPTDLYLKSPEEMAELFDDLPEAIESARNIGARCNVELDFDSSHVPLVGRGADRADALFGWRSDGWFSDHWLQVRTRTVRCRARQGHHRRRRRT